MLDERQFDDLREIFPTLVLFGDPAQLAPVGQSGEMVFDRCPSAGWTCTVSTGRLTTIPILDLAHALADEAELTSRTFERDGRGCRGARDDRVQSGPNGWTPT
jgi:exodeoxyribonuclease-5